MKLKHHELLAKGWKEEEIAEAEDILGRAKADEKPVNKIINTLNLGLVLIILVVGTFGVSVTLSPLMMALNDFSIYPLTALIALSLGTLITVLVKDIEKQTEKHHVAISLITPATAITSFAIVINETNTIALAAGMNTVQNPLLISTTYLAFFLAPYTYFLIKKLVEEHESDRVAHRTR